MAGGGVEIQARQIAHEQPGIAFGIGIDLQRQRLAVVHVREAKHFEDAYRIALLGHQQTLVGGVIGQPFEALVAIATNAQRKLLEVGRVEYARGIVIRTLTRRCSRSSAIT
jgi:hypothetical protein